MHRINQQWRLKKRPVGALSKDDFAWHEVPSPELKAGEFRARHLYLSLDPTNRIWVNEEDSYLPAVGVGDVMRGSGIGIVEESRHDGFKVGDIVTGVLGWQTYPLLNGDTDMVSIIKPDGLPLPAFHSIFGASGLTAYFGLMDIGQPKKGETLVVSAAAGAVGSLVGQIGKREGCRVVGIAGSDKKCEWLKESLGFDAVINYKTEDVAAGLSLHCPDGIDIYFDNVGGEILDAALALINKGARVPLCGLISTYNDEEKQPGPRNLGKVLIKSATLRGFIVIDFLHRAEEAMNYLGAAYAAGDLQYQIHEVVGLENAPEALGMLFTGENNGKLVIKVDPDWE